MATSNELYEQIEAAFNDFKENHSVFSEKVIKQLVVEQENLSVKLKS